VATGLEPVAEVGWGRAEVHEVASNRRVDVLDGRVHRSRSSSCQDPAVRALPVGTIDPWLRTVAFYSSMGRKLAALHFYASHPMSYYGDGVVTADFVGLARKQRQADEPTSMHIFFNGCAGNVAAGKYNDGSLEARPELQSKIYKAIVASEAALLRQPLQPMHAHDWVRGGWM
jgi:hypothetical protein